MSELVKVLASTNTTATVVGTAKNNLFNAVIPGGLLGTNNKLRFEMAGLGTFISGAELTFYLVYAGQTVAQCSILSTSSGTQSNKAVIVRAELRGDGNVNAQFGTIRVDHGLAAGLDVGIATGVGTINGASSADQNFTLKAGWNNNGANQIVHRSSTLEYLGFVQEVETPELEEPTAYIWLNSKLNYLDYRLRKNIYFYAPLEHELAFYGLGSATFTRAGFTNALWRDGAMHSVGPNKPRFEYSTSQPLGMAIATVSEILTFDSANALHDGNTVVWMEDLIVKSTLTHPNPFNSAGKWVGSSGVHIHHIVKLNKVGTTAEVSAIGAAISALQLTGGYGYGPYGGAGYGN